MNRFATFYFLIVLIFLIGCNSKNNPQVFDLRCESLQNPLGIDKTTPRFSWKISSKKNNTEQKAFQILVATERFELTENKVDLWNSGKVASSASVFVPYQGQKLNPGTAAWWKVRVWDEAGNVSGWSEPARFSIGLLSETDWQATYIAYNTENGYNECPQVYQSFNVDETGSNYFLHVNSLGYHEVFLNGKKVGEGVLAPAVSQFNKRSLINTYDVSGFLQKGKNEIILWLGSGWYTQGLPGVVNNGPVVRAQLEKIKNNQREVILVTGENWKGRISSYTRHGNWRPNQFGGEIMDGTLAENDLQTGNPENPWGPVSLIAIPAHHASPQMTEQNAITDTICPVSIREIAPDTFLVDMGKNLTGWVEFHFPELQKAQEIKLDYCDHLTGGGQFNDRNQWNKYIASGTSPEKFINKFNYNGFRYIRITGLNEKPEAESIQAYLIHTHFEPAATFECSDPDLNAIHDMLQYTLQCLSLGSDFVDCPQIERLGYGGDGNASTLTAQIMYHLAPVYNNWLQAWSDVIREDGGMPHTAPNPYRAGGGPYWCGFIVTATWNTYLNYGDTLVLEKYYPAMQKWLGYVDAHTIDGLLKRWPDTDYRGWYLGDWATPKGIDQTDERSVDLVNNSFIAVCFDNMEHMAGVLGKPDDAQLYASKKQQLQEKIHETFFDETTHTYATGTQIDLAFPMIAGVVPAEMFDAVKKSLYHETEVNRNGHLATGLVGLPVLTEWVVENNEVDLMYSMLKKRDYPGYLYMIDNGATTTWEHWDGARSHIHNCYSGIGSWFYQAVGGIRPEENVPAYRKVRIQPQIPVGVTWANTSQETPFGKLVVNWNMDGEMLNLDFEIPVGVEAEVVLPDAVSYYKVDGKEYELNDLDEKRVDLKSGKYKISYKRS